MTSTKHGIASLLDPSFNKSTGFTDAEKRSLGIVGLVPDVTESIETQLSRVLKLTETARAQQESPRPQQTEHRRDPDNEVDH
jgi:hypothetical protein